ncbi:MAG: hypothetical protein IJ068_01195 [Bacilli bacterium]|nr:hypothetical protein [Bacilli bacterium]
MNIIVTNKYKDLIYSANIEILKELNGVFKVSQIVNSFNSIFYKKIIIDATALENFPKENVLKELAAAFEKDKLILLLPPDNPPPKKFLSFLVSINIYNFTDNASGLLELVHKSNKINDVKNYIEEREEKIAETKNEESTIHDENDLLPQQVILGFNGVTGNSYVTEIIYSIKKELEERYQKKVLAIEVEKRDFVFYNSSSMMSIGKDKVNIFLQNNLNDYDFILVDLSNYNNTTICNDVIYLVNPSLYEVNKIMMKDRTVFMKLKGKKVVFSNSLLTSNDVNQFAREAGISVYYNLTPINDRGTNDNISKLLTKMGVLDNESSDKSTKKGLFDIFK